MCRGKAQRTEGLSAFLGDNSFPGTSLPWAMTFSLVSPCALCPHSLVSSSALFFWCTGLLKNFLCRNSGPAPDQLACCGCPYQTRPGHKTCENLAWFQPRKLFGCACPLALPPALKAFPAWIPQPLSLTLGTVAPAPSVFVVFVTVFPRSLFIFLLSDLTIPLPLPCAPSCYSFLLALVCKP